MRANDGVGMAAPQAGVMKRLFIYDVSDEQDSAQALINPVITQTSDDLVTADEGCLSFPNIYFPITRPARITVEALDEKGQEILLEDVDGLLARVIQHECDHLDGVMILDRAQPHIKKQALRAYATFDQQSEEFITIIDERAYDGTENG
jgi:peptide deformylase